MFLGIKQIYTHRIKQIKLRNMAATNLIVKNIPIDLYLKNSIFLLIV